jgi:hypothetical protein
MSALKKKYRLMAHLSSANICRHIWRNNNGIFASRHRGMAHMAQQLMKKRICKRHPSKAYGYIIWRSYGAA